MDLEIYKPIPFYFDGIFDFTHLGLQFSVFHGLPSFRFVVVTDLSSSDEILSDSAAYFCFDWVPIDQQLYDCILTHFKNAKD